MATRILSLDGGGLRGIFTSHLLCRLQDAVPDLITKADLLAGTSTGGLIALGLASGMKPAELVNLYKDRGPEIFSRPWYRGFIPGVSKYDGKGLQKVLEEVFGQRLLSDLPKRVLVSAFDLDRWDGTPPPGQHRVWKAKFFHNYPGPGTDGPTPVVKAARYTSAAPTFFPPVDGFVDGGVVANNPSVCAAAKAIKAGARYEDLRVLSVGTGFNPKHLDGKDKGLIGWAPNLVGIFMEGGVDVADYQLEQFLGDRYHRLNDDLPREIELDDLKAVPMLLELAEKTDIRPAVAWLRANW